jgi:hypothetical protein
MQICTLFRSATWSGRKSCRDLATLNAGDQFGDAFRANHSRIGDRANGNIHQGRYGFAIKLQFCILPPEPAPPARKAPRKR